MKKIVSILAAACFAAVSLPALSQGMGDKMEKQEKMGKQDGMAKHKAKPKKKMDKMEKMDKQDGMAKDKMGK